MDEPSGSPGTRAGDSSGASADSITGADRSPTGATPSASATADADGSAAPGEERRKGPLSYLSGALTSGMMAWICLILSQRMVDYYVAHPPRYSSAIAQSIATGFKTLILGMGFLATFTFAFIGLGLFLVFLRCLIPARAGTPS